MLKEYPLHHNQHAFRKGRSTESALSDVVDAIEKQVMRGGFALGIFLDIEGAFDNAMPQVVARELERRGAPLFLINWLNYYLTHRRAKDCRYCWRSHLP